MAINIKKHPVLTEIVKVWSYNPGVRIMVGMDTLGDVWIVENCPAGSWAWRADEVRQVKTGRTSARMFAEPLKLAERLMRTAKEVNRLSCYLDDTSVCIVR